MIVGGGNAYEVGAAADAVAQVIIGSGPLLKGEESSARKSRK